MCSKLVGVYKDRDTGETKQYALCYGCKSKKPNKEAGERYCCVIQAGLSCMKVVRPGADGKPNYVCWDHRGVKVHHKCGVCGNGYNAMAWRTHMENPKCPECYRAQAPPRFTIADLLG